jgi:hypothetical protein
MDVRTAALLISAIILGGVLALGLIILSIDRGRKRARSEMRHHLQDIARRETL